MSMILSRRSFLRVAAQTGGAAVLQSLLPVRFAFANTPGDARLMVVILRGAMDGLAAVVPYGDAHYADARGPMAMPQHDATLINLDGYFAMHHALKLLAEMFQRKEMVICHAVATPYRSRSHFDAQDLMENGTATPHALTTGWLNRAVAACKPSPDAMAIGSFVPLMLRGPAQVGSWAPNLLPDVDDEFLSRVARMYDNDPLLHSALTSGQELRSMESGKDKNPGGPRAFVEMMRKAATFMAPEKGAHIATAELGGWDTHAGQGLDNGRLAGNFAVLAEGLNAFRQGMGEAWKRTAVICMTEFGRTVHGNGTGGTDHGTASVAFLLGGAVNGGRIIGDWPGLKTLYEDRDLMPANDMRGVFKSVLHQHIGLAEETLDAVIFPDSANVWYKDKLFS